MMFCRKFRKNLSYKSKDTYVEFLHISSSFIDIDRSMRVCTYLVKNMMVFSEESEEMKEFLDK